MKRRTFFGILGGTTAAAALAITYKEEAVKQSAEYIAKRKARALFQRFFKVATTFEANPMQMFWYDQYASGQVNHFNGARQSGMTTFMLAIALFENKCSGINISWFPSNSYMRIHCQRLVSVMEERLGKSVLDGKIYSHNDDLQRLSTSSKPLKVFVMTDANRFPKEWSNSSPYLREVAYFFETGEDRMYDPRFFNVTIPKVNSKFPTIS